ncbi:type II secretion system protein N [Frateuria aurantia]
MKRVRNLAVWGLLAGAMVVLLISFLPASWALSWYRQRLPDLQLRQVSGTVWRGQAGQLLSPAGVNLGSLHWELSPALLLGRLDLHVALSGAGLTASGQLQQQPGQPMAVDQAELRATPQVLSRVLGQHSWPYAGPLYLEVTHAVLWHGWPMTLEAQLVWCDASVLQSPQPLSLGRLLLRAHGRQGVLTGDFQDDGNGPLQLHGTASLSPLGWKVVADAGGRTADRALQTWLGRFGVPDKHGIVHVRLGGGLLDYLH